ncbi:hypothetical protein MtrunA17_Chr6g0448801 [Medicago truncatula]|uniref:Uncharacterized protein n=1 Tax=Medicago truncatula TaxID=3880 RepID=A0A396HAG7_MEDTR|nr:hypothetical protein MtrunA17_Chr6g0448801 [Medicago truncatula]
MFSVLKLEKFGRQRQAGKWCFLVSGIMTFTLTRRRTSKKIWAVGTVNLKPGLLRFSQWTKDFKFQTQKQTHVSLWIRLVELPQEYWRET